ncbi:hypothetical protein BGC31_09810 [Komagataeibacter xylinus]|nr:hypothetical protein H845_1300 [Komagataeibacter xylinus E25]RFO99387.1 hypothetical protein BGC31_09810 [Komagataeibacter xylinus]RFP07577.1 hypothetical protein BFX83_07185 [Komagataeibacter xylinus]
MTGTIQSEYVNASIRQGIPICSKFPFLSYCTAFWAKRATSLSMTGAAKTVGGAICAGRAYKSI